MDTKYYTFGSLVHINFGTEMIGVVTRLGERLLIDMDKVDEKEIELARVETPVEVVVHRVGNEVIWVRLIQSWANELDTEKRRISQEKTEEIDACNNN